MQRYLRLRHRADFERLRAEGKVWHHPMIIMSLAPNFLPHNRIGFIISKRLGKAVIRNRLRRQLRACVAALNAGLLSGYDMVFIPRPSSLKLDYHGLCSALADVLREAGLWKPTP